MLDELLGRAELKERIEELEAERDRLQSQLDAERERRAEAVSDRQESQERANKLEDRIADLEGQLERAHEGERVVEFRGTENLGGDRLRDVVSRLDGYRTGPEGALTALVDGSTPEAIREILGERAALVNRAEPCLVLVDDAAIVSVAIEPPLSPAPFVEWGESFRLEREWFLPEGEYAIALVRSDIFAYGEYADGKRVDFEGFESDIKSDHSKGGYSQSRFERGRDEQIDEHLDRCREVIEGRDPDRLIVLGERTVIHEFADRATETATVDATGKPEPALADAVDSFWSTTLYLL